MLAAQRHVVARIIRQPGLAIGQAGEFRFTRRGRRHELHQAARPDIRHRTRVHLAFLTRQSQHQRAFHLRLFQQRIGDQRIGGIRGDDALGETGFCAAHADVRHVVFGGQLRELDIVRLGLQQVVEVIGEGAEQLRFTSLAQKAQGLDHRAAFKGGNVCVRRLRGRREIDLLVADFFRCELTVIGGFVGGGVEIGDLRPCRLAEGCFGAARPVLAARQADRRRYAFGHRFEVLQCPFRIAVHAQRNPAGHPFGIGKVGAFFHAMRGGELVGALPLAVFQVAAQRDGAFFPKLGAPGFRDVLAIDRRQQRNGPVLVAMRAAPAGAVIQKARIVLQVFRHSIDQRVDISGAAGQRDAGIDQFAIVRRQQLFQVRGSRALVGPEQELDAGAVILLGQLAAEPGQNLTLKRAVHGIAVPGVTDDLHGVVHLAHFAQGIGQRDLALAGAGTGGFQPVDPLGGGEGREFDDFFGPGAHIAGLRPVGQAGQRVIDLREAHARHAFAGARPHDQVAHGGICGLLLQAGHFFPVVALGRSQRLVQDLGVLRVGRRGGIGPVRLEARRLRHASGSSAGSGEDGKQGKRDGSDHMSCHRVFISEPKRGKAEAIHIWIIPNNT